MLHPASRGQRSRTFLPDAVLGGVIAAFAWWTVLFHIATPLGWHRDLVMSVWVGGLVAGAALLIRTRPFQSAKPLALTTVRPGPAWQVGGVALCTVVAFTASAVQWVDDGPEWWLFWATAVALGSWVVVLIVRAPRAGQRAPSTHPTSAVTTGTLVLVLAVAALASIGSLVTQRPDADDVFLVNRSSWVAEHPGPLPRRDTIYSDEVFAVTREDAVPTAIEPLIGGLAAWTSFSAPSLTYLGVGPLAAGLAVVALWRLLRTLGAAEPALATAAATVFLLLDGGSHASFGNFGFGRSWQGKVVFLTVILPTVWHHALRWTRDRSRRDLGLLCLANIAAIGLTTTAVFVAPTVTVLGALAGAAGTGGWRRIWLAVASTTPLALAAIAMGFLPDQAPGPLVGVIRPLSPLLGAIKPWELWHFVLADRIPLALIAIAAFTSWITLQDRAARLTVALAPLTLFGLYYAPSMLDAIDQIAGAGSILWRVAWIVPVPASVGLVLTAPFAVPGAWRDRALLSACLAIVVFDLMVIGSPTVLDADGGTQGVHVGGPAWDIDENDRRAAARLLELTPAGGLIAAPELIGGAIAIQTTRVRAVNPRTSYTAAGDDVDGFLAEERLLLSRAVAFGVGPNEAGEVERSLDVLGVVTACVTKTAARSEPLTTALSSRGFTPADADAHCTYWTRPDPG
ncbi:MAG: DUF6077 domain-containing protein [Microthrixaceae bacterium]